MNRRELLHGAAASAAALAWPARASAAGSALDPVLARIEGQHAESVKRLQDWIRLPSIAAENRGVGEGCDFLIGDAQGRGIRPRGADSDGRIAGRLRHARRRRAAHRRRVLHVRRQTGRPGRVVLAPLRRRDRGQGRLRQGRGRPRRRQPEGTRGRVPRGPPRVPRRRPEAAGQPRARRRGRGGDRIAALSADRAPPGRPGRAREVHGRLHARGGAGLRRHGHRLAGRQGRDRAGADVLRRALGPRPEEGHPFEQQGPRGQPGLAPRDGAVDARHRRRQHARDRGLRGPRPSDLRRPKRPWSPTPRSG